MQYCMIGYMHNNGIDLNLYMRKESLKYNLIACMILTHNSFGLGLIYSVITAYNSQTLHGRP